MKKGELLGLMLEHEVSKWASTQISPLPPIHGNAPTHGPRYPLQATQLLSEITHHARAVARVSSYNNPLSPTHPTCSPSCLPPLWRPTPFTVSASHKHHQVFHLTSASHVPAFYIFESLYSLGFSTASRIPHQSLRVNLISLPLGKSVRRHFFFFSFPGCL